MIFDAHNKHSANLLALDKNDLMKVYRNSKFAPSLSLDEMAHSGDFDP